MARGNSPMPAALLALFVVAVLVLAAVAATPLASVLADPPQVSLDVDRPRTAGPDEAAATVTFTHDGGDEIPAERVHVVVAGERVAERETLTLSRSASTFETGERIVVEQTEPDGLTGGERVVLVAERGDTVFRLRAVNIPE